MHSKIKGYISKLFGYIVSGYIYGQNSEKQLNEANCNLI